MNRFFRALFRVILGELRKFNEDYLHLQDPSDRFRNRLRIMYGRGEISRGQFFQLRNRINRGQLMQGELLRLHQEAELKMELKGTPIPRQHRAGIGRRLERLYLDRGLLEEARFEIEQSIQALEKEIEWIDEQATSARQEAQSSLPDEVAARAFLNIWQNLGELCGGLDERRQVLKHNLHRVLALEAELRAYEAGLKVLDSQEHLEGLRVRIDQDFTGWHR